MTDEKAGTPTPEAPAPAAEAAPTKPKSFSDVSDSESDSRPMPKAIDEAASVGAKEDEDDEDEGEEAGEDGEDADEELEADSDEEDAEEGESEDDEEELDEEAQEGADGETEVHKVKVNGKLKEYTLKQMKQLVSSGAHLVETRQAFQTEVSKVQAEIVQEQTKLKGIADNINPAWELLNKNDVEGSFLELAKVKGVSKLDARRQLRRQMLPVIANMLGLSQQEVTQRLTQNAERNRVLDTQEENEFLKSDRDTPPPKKEEGAEVAGAEAVKAFQIEHGVSKGEMTKAVDWLLQNKLGGDGSKLSLDEVSKTVLQGRVVDKALEAIQAIRPRLIKDQKFVNRVVKKLSFNPDWSVARAARWIKKTVRTETEGQKDSEAQKLAKDVGRKVLQGKPKTELTKPGTQQKKPMSFRDFDDENRLM